MRITLCTAATAAALFALFSMAASSPYAGRAGAVQRTAAPVQLFKLTLQNNTRLPLSQDSITTPNVDLHLYGDGRNIIVATGSGANFPRTFCGLCKGPCGFSLRDRNNHFDLRGNANMTFTTIVSGFHRVRPIIKLADGTLLIGDQAEGSVADYHQYTISFSECRWLK